MEATTTSAGFPRRISSLDEVFRFVDEFVDRAGLDERVGLRLTLAVEELFTNLVRHNRGGGDQIEVHLAREGDRVHLSLEDVDVEPFDPATVAEVPVSAGVHERRPGGLGLHLVRSLFDRLDYQYDEERRCMRILVTTTVGR